jgi:error-prone DNA polymerase
MGFYAPAQLVQDARRHGVEVRPVDVVASAYECSLEAAQPAPAVRLGLVMVKGLSEEGARRVVAARSDTSPSSVEDLARRAALDRRDLRALSAAGAFGSLSAHRREAYWAVAGVETRPHLLRTAPVSEPWPKLASPTEGENIAADYGSVGFTLGRHPLALLRRRLTRMRLATAAKILALPHGRRARAAGLVICRQRPGTASGVVFVTLEDETGCVNIVVWNDLVERQRRELLGSRLMEVDGVVEREGDVVHLVARQLADHSALLGTLQSASRDFH